MNRDKRYNKKFEEQELKQSDEVGIGASEQWDIANRTLADWRKQCAWIGSSVKEGSYPMSRIRRKFFSSL